MEFIPYKEALALKSLGFDKSCFAFYQEEYAEIKPTMVDDDDEYRLTGWRTCKNSEIPENYTSAPTFSQAFKFFREEYNIDVNIQKDSIGIYHFNIDTNKYGDWMEPIFNKIYEDVELACLRKLIEIVESK
jgi:hypothetical protein